MPVKTISLAELDRQSKPPIERALEQHDPEHLRLDVEQVFLLYATFCGDTEQTAAALGCPARYVAQLADSEGWNEKLAPIIARKKSKRPGDVERAINRALCFTQAHRYRSFLERVMKKMMAWSDEELDGYLVRFEQKKGAPEGEGNVKVNARALADFAVALQKCAEMTYLALNDTTPERGKRKEDSEDGELSLSAIHAQLARGMSSEPQTGVGQLMAAQIERAQAETAQTLAAEPVRPPAPIQATPEPPKSPYNRD